MKGGLEWLAWIVGLPGVASLIVLAATRFGEAQDRRRKVFGKAFAACRAYYEFPYVVRRRGRKDGEAERLRISDDLRVVQQDLAYYRGWIGTESKSVARAYVRLVDRLRAVVGPEIRAAWESEPAQSDQDMSFTIDLSEVIQAEDTYLATVRRHLSFLRWRAGIWAVCQLVRLVVSGGERLLGISRPGSSEASTTEPAHSSALPQETGEATPRQMTP